MSEAHHLPNEAPDEEVKTPFSFKLMVVLAVVYLGWRLIQGIIWVVQQIG